MYQNVSVTRYGRDGIPISIFSDRSFETEDRPEIFQKYTTFRFRINQSIDFIRCVSITVTKAEKYKNIYIYKTENK